MNFNEKDFEDTFNSNDYVYTDDSIFDDLWSKAKVSDIKRGDRYDIVKGTYKVVLENSSGWTDDVTNKFRERLVSSGLFDKETVDRASVDVKDFSRLGYLSIYFCKDFEGTFDSDEEGDYIHELKSTTGLTVEIHAIENGEHEIGCVDGTEAMDFIKSIISPDILNKISSYVDKDIEENAEDNDTVFNAMQDAFDEMDDEL